MNTQKKGGCASNLIALAFFVVGGAAILYIAPSVQPDSTKNMPDDRQQIQQIIQKWHGPQLPKITSPIGEVFTVSMSTKG